MRFKGETMLTVLIAVFAFTAVASATASAALPEFVPGTGEKLPAKLEGALPGATEVTLTNETKNGIYCNKGAAFKGEVTGAKAASLTAELQNCSAEGLSGYKCHTSGAEEGRVVVSGTGALDYIVKATKQVGLILKVTKTEVACGGAYSYVIRGSVVIPLTPINTKTSKLDMAIKRGANGKQEFTSYENEKGEITAAKFEIEGGAGFQPLVWNVEKEIALTSSKPLTIDA